MSRVRVSTPTYLRLVPHRARRVVGAISYGVDNVKVLYDAVSVQILSSANNIHVVENNSVAQLLHYAITSDGHLQCCAARLRSNHQYANVPIPTESLCAVSPIIIVSNK
ncbi:hypothetical protein Tco_0915591 [Tanacetum coccineum]